MAFIVYPQKINNNIWEEQIFTTDYGHTGDFNAHHPFFGSS